MARGIERRAIFRDHHDQDDFVDRLAHLAKESALTVYAWALIPNTSISLFVPNGDPCPAA